MFVERCKGRMTSGRTAYNAFISTIFRTTAHSCAAVSYRNVFDITFQDGLVEMMEKHAKKGRLVYVSGKLQTRKWRKDGEDSDRFSTEILLVPGSRVQFLDKPNGNGAPAMNGRRPCLPAKPPRRWMTAKFRSKRASSLPHNSGPVPAKLAWGWPLFFGVPFEPASTEFQKRACEAAALRAPLPRGPHRQKFEAGLKGVSRNKHERFPMQPFRAITPLRDRTP